jgi:hypothetical protein
MLTMNDDFEAKIKATLLDAGGHLAHAARTLGLKRWEIWERIANVGGFRRFYIDIRETQLDDAEAALFRAVEAEKSWAVLFSLKTIGKKRGYSKHPGFQAELDLLPANPEPDFSEFSPEERADYERLIGKVIVPKPAGTRPAPAFVVGVHGHDNGSNFDDSSGPMARRDVDEGTPAERAARAEACAEAVDAAEEALLQKVVQGKAWAICFVLKTLGKNRGYCEKFDAEQDAAAPREQPELDFSRLTDDEYTELQRLEIVLRSKTRPSGCERPAKGYRSGNGSIL